MFGHQVWPSFGSSDVTVLVHNLVNFYAGRLFLCIPGPVLELDLPLEFVLGPQPLDLALLLETKACQGPCSWPVAWLPRASSRLAHRVPRSPRSPVVGFPKLPLFAAVSTVCFANVPGSAHHMSRIRCGIRQWHRRGPCFPPMPQDDAQKRNPLGTLAAPQLIGPLIRLPNRGWLVTQMMDRWSDSVASITSSNTAMFVVGASRSVMMWSQCFLRLFLHPACEFSKSQKVVSTVPLLHVTNSNSGMSRSFGVRPSEHSPITDSHGRANSTLLSIPRNTGFSVLPLAFATSREPSWNACMYSVSLLPE